MVQDQHQLSGFLATTLPKVLLALGAVFSVIAFFIFKQDPKMFYFSYLTVFAFFLSITLGSLFFVILFRLVRAGWSVSLRRIPELFTKNFVFLALCFIPLLLGMHELYHWAAHHGGHDAILVAKAPYLNVPFFIVRLFFYFGTWIVLGHLFYKHSVQQDSTGDLQHSLALQKYSTFGVLLFAITITFSSIDWIMSVTPHWYSTMFGVQFFAGSAVASLATISLVALVLRRFGFLTHVIKVDHFHDLGKLIYGFNVFWAYVTFSQYFLIWYANIPEETMWYLQHFAGKWHYFGWIIPLSHFAFPFLAFMSRHAKRNLPFHAFMMVWFLVVHFVDLYWIIMPNALPSGPHFGVREVVLILAMGGLYLGLFFNRMKSVSLYPVKDPRLDESLRLEVM